MSASKVKRRVALAASVGLLAFAGCGGGGGGGGPTYATSGAVSGAIADGVLVTLTGNNADTTTTAGGGLYSFSGLANGSYTLTPSLAGYTFRPASIVMTVAGANVTGQDFTAVLPWSSLVSRSWTLPAGSEGFRCTRIAVPSDLYLTGFKVDSPGVARGLVTVSDTQSPMGDYDCSPNSIDSHLIYAFGIGTDAISFPAGVGVHVKAGQTINLYLDTYNSQSVPTTQTASIFAQMAIAAAVLVQAEMVMTGSFSISIPNDGLPHTANGGCAAPSNWHVFAMLPLMGVVATHQEVQFNHSSVDQVLLDSDFDRLHAQFKALDPALNVQANDFLETTCTYVNNTPMPFTFGDGIDAESCFTGMYLYSDTTDDLFRCVSN